MLKQGRLWLKIDGELLHVEAVEKATHGCVLYLPAAEWLVFRSTQEAGNCAYERMKGLAESDPEGFMELVGPETLARWALGQPAGPGTRRFTSPALARTIGFTPGVAYLRSVGFDARSPAQKVMGFFRGVCCRLATL